MVGSLKDFPNTEYNQKELLAFQYTEVILKILGEINHMQCSKTGSLLHRKPHGLPSLLCKSGPVAHVDDDDDEHYAEFDIDANILHKSYIKEEPIAASPASPYLHPEDKFCVVVDKDEKRLPSFSRSDMDFFLGSDHVVGHKSAVDIDGAPKASIDKNDKTVKICWPSGSYYEGQMVNGYLHGTGTYRSTDGSVYEGNWVMSKKHGFGRKRYANGDFYEGIWKFDVQEGLGRYTWSDGSEYCGGWKNGTMSGHGVLSWSNGDTYDGQWLNGVTDGHGIYTSDDGSTFFATWRNGSKCENRMLYSLASDNHQYCQHIYHNSNPGEIQDNDCSNQKNHDNILPKEMPKKLWQGTSLDESALRMLASTINAPKRHDHLLLGSLPLWTSEVTPRPNTCNMSESSKESSQPTVPDYRKQRSLSTTEKKLQPGETVHKGHGSYDLMLGLQLGIRYSVGKITPQQTRKLGKSDFSPKSCISVNFPKEGSQRTPPHQSASFKWKDYCPMVFRHLRETFKIDAADYMLSICGNDALREFSSPGKSGSVFYLSQDERFIIKTLRKNEVKVLLRMLPNYYKHVQMYENTLLTRFFGLHRIKLTGGQKVRFIVMGNVVSTDSWIHRRYDLKGSSQGRVIGRGDTNESTATLKDLDLEYSFELKSPLRDAVLEQIYRDCIFLESENIMDYSLLLGIHFKERSIPKTMAGGSVSDLPLNECVISRFVETDECFLETKSLHSSSLNLKKSSSLNDQRSSSTLNLKERINLPNERVSNQLGFHMPAKAYSTVGNISGWNNVEDNPGYDVVLYFGIIDILQEYDMGKKIEHAYKSMQYDPLSISAVDPILYSRRFQSFMHDVFPPPKA